MAEINAEKPEDVLEIVEIASIAPAERQLGTIHDLKIEAGADDKGQKYKRLILTVELEARDDDGKKFMVTKEYNLLGRGAASFCSDYWIMLKKKITTQDLRKFTKSQIIGTEAEFEIKHKMQEKTMVAYISEIFPVTTEAVKK